MDECIFLNPGMRENNIFDIVKRMAKVFQNKSYKSKVNQSDKRWIDAPINDIFEKILHHFIDYNNCTPYRMMLL